MLVSLVHFDWQVLRCLVRAEARDENPTGRELRVWPTRGTKDGTFLDDLVAVGLIVVTEKPTKPEPGKEHEPPQFRARYRLTDKGRHAAEYGEYERSFTPRTDAPLVGLAAEVVGPLMAKAAAWLPPPDADAVDGKRSRRKSRKK